MNVHGWYIFVNSDLHYTICCKKAIVNGSSNLNSTREIRGSFFFRRALARIGEPPTGEATTTARAKLHGVTRWRKRRAERWRSWEWKGGAGDRKWRHARPHRRLQRRRRTQCRRSTSKRKIGKRNFINTKTPAGGRWRLEVARPTLRSPLLIKCNWRCKSWK